MTARERKLLDHLAETARDGGAMPTSFQMADAIDVCPSAIPVLLQQLEARGAIRQLRGRGNAGNQRVAIVAGNGAWRLEPARPRQALAKRLCLRCRKPFRPASRWLFCCEGCRRCNARGDVT